jgi:hypothetical protein
MLLVMLARVLVTTENFLKSNSLPAGGVLLCFAFIAFPSETHT